MRIRDRLRLWQGETLLGALWLARAISKPLRLQGPYHSFLIHLLKKSELFDRGYYLDRNSDVVSSGMPPLRHYVLYGDREGRAPMALFDPAYYRTHASGLTMHVNTLLHYLYVGRYRRISPSPWIDIDYYLTINKDVARANIDPLIHFLKWGGVEGRSPSPNFSSSYYLSSYPDVARARINPLLHYVLVGRFENRPGHAEGETIEASNRDMAGMPKAVLPSSSEWSRLTPRNQDAEPAIDVVVPVYKGCDETLRCLYSLLVARCDTPFELTVINDRSPDVNLVAELQKLAARGHFSLLNNTENRGFVYCANRGISLHKTRDVVLLNSDTEVYDHWLDRLRAAALRNARTGTVTPLSNNATIASYPRALHDNPWSLEIGYNKLDAMMAELNRGVEVEAPTGVGFCVYIKRDCLDDVGSFDEFAFGKGYGEENDFCQRALAKGWRNIIVADIFVRHWGATSFQGEKSKRIEKAMEVLGKRYPRYHQEVAEFIKNDPLYDARQRIDWGRLLLLRRDKNVLVVTHNRGGGTERHVQEDVQRLSHAGYGVYLLRPMQGSPGHAILSHAEIKSLPNIHPQEMNNFDSLRRMAEQLRTTELHIHNLVDFQPGVTMTLMALVNALGLRLEMNIHDYAVICPRINLATENGDYCGEPAAALCNSCLARQGSPFGVKDIAQWRRMKSALLHQADVVLVPDEDVAARLAKYYPEITYEISPHEAIAASLLSDTRQAIASGNRLRIVIIGAISKIKGFDTLLACARDAQKRKLPLDFVVMGYSLNDNLLREAGVTVTGRYCDEQAAMVLKGLQPDLVWLPSLWPETYSYTLSLALEGGCRVTAFDIGAIAGRLRKLGRGAYLVPLALARKPKELNELFVVWSREGRDQARPVPNNHS